MIDLLIETGRMLHGPQWQSELARDLGVSDRTMRRWLARQQEPPAGILDDLLRLVLARGRALQGLAKRLEEASRA
jgi:hypothetical protein